MREEPGEAGEGGSRQKVRKLGGRVFLLFSLENQINAFTPHRVSTYNGYLDLKKKSHLFWLSFCTVTFLDGQSTDTLVKDTVEHFRSAVPQVVLPVLKKIMQGGDELKSARMEVRLQCPAFNMPSLGCFREVSSESWISQHEAWAKVCPRDTSDNHWHVRGILSLGGHEITLGEYIEWKQWRSGTDPQGTAVFKGRAEARRGAKNEQQGVWGHGNPGRAVWSVPSRKMETVHGHWISHEGPFADFTGGEGRNYTVVIWQKWKLQTFQKILALQSKREWDWQLKRELWSICW